MDNPKITEFEIESASGIKIKVTCTKKWSIFRHLDHRVDHLEFRGNFNETGYRSAFSFVGLDDDYDEVEAAKKVLKSEAGIVFDLERPVQACLFA